MKFDSIPNFGDSKAKIRERVHSESGTNIIEVLYGARDSYGNPVSPEGNSDGHGHWIALEIGGQYQMLSWRLPKSEGGSQKYGKSRSDNVLNDLECDIRAKLLLCSQAESVAFAKDWKKGSQELADITESWKKLFNWNTPKENELWARFQSAKKRFFDEREEQRKRNKAAKKAIISEASSVVHSSEWTQTNEKLKTLMDKWKTVGSAGKDDDDALWNEFNNVRQIFYDRQKGHYKELEDKQHQSMLAKRDLISEARSVSQYSENWKETGAALNAMLERWKSIGGAGRDHEDQLWKEFSGIRQAFFDRRSAYYEQLKNQQINNAAEKGRIVNEAHIIARLRDYSPEQTERMKALDVEWKSVGSAGRDKEDSLWQIFRDAKDSFWAGKREEGERKHREWEQRQYEREEKHRDWEQRQREFREKLYDAISRKHDQISSLENQISNLRDKMYGMRNQEYIDNMCGWIAEKENKIDALRSAIYDMENKLRG